MQHKTLPLDQIRIDGGTQARAGIREEVVSDYVEAMQGDVEFPPLAVFHDAENYWLVDGFHRYHAAVILDLDGFRCEIHTGSRNDAILYAVGCNTFHGLQRSRGDKAAAVNLIFEHITQATTWSDRQIAEAARVSHPFVATIRAERAEASKPTPPRRPRTDDAPPEPEPTPASEVVTDALGEVITNLQLRQTFLDSAHLQALHAELGRIAKQVAVVADEPVGAHLHVQDLHTHLRNARRAIKWAMPYCVVPPKAAEHNPAWGKVGWLTQDQYDHLPDEHKA